MWSVKCGSGRLSKFLEQIGAIGHQPSGDKEEAFVVDRREIVPGGERDDQITVTTDNGAAVTIRPPPGEFANLPIARSISGAWPTLIGITSTPIDGATD